MSRFDFDRNVFLGGALCVLLYIVGQFLAFVFFSVHIARFFVARGRSTLNVRCYVVVFFT